MKVLKLNLKSLKMDPDPAAKWKFIGIHHKLCYLPSCHCFKLVGKNTPVWLNTSWYIYIPGKIQVLTQSEKATSLPVRSFKKGLGFTGTVAIGPWSPDKSATGNVHIVFIDVWEVAESSIQSSIIHISVYIEVIYHTLNHFAAPKAWEAKIFLVLSGLNFCWLMFSSEMSQQLCWILGIAYDERKQWPPENKGSGVSLNIQKMKFAPTVCIKVYIYIYVRQKGPFPTCKLIVYHNKNIKIIFL